MIAEPRAAGVPVCEASCGQPVVVKVREVGRVLVFGNEYGNLYFIMVMGELYLRGKGFFMECRPISGCCRFLFFRLIFSCILSEAFEGRLPRPGGMVDGKFYGFCLLTNLRET